jgi:hypothetical protein
MNDDHFWNSFERQSEFSPERRGQRAFLCAMAHLRWPHIARPRGLPEKPGLNDVVFQCVVEVELLA